MTFYDNLPGGVFCCRAEEGWPLESCNLTFCQMYGCTEQAEVRAFLGGGLLGTALPADVREAADVLRGLSPGGPAARAACRMARKDGGVFWGHYLLQCRVDPQGQSRIYGMLADMTDRRDQLQENSRRGECLYILTEIGNHVLFDLDAASGTLKLFGDFEKRFGRKPQLTDFQVDHTAGDDVQIEDWSPEHMPRLHGLQSETIRQDVQLHGPDGRTIWCQYQTRVFRDAQGRTVRRIGRLINMEEIRAREEALRRQAQCDPMTGVLNREAAQKQMECVLRAGAGQYIMVMIDLDNFKHINDAYGHPTGDLVLRHLARELEDTFRSRDIIGRLGGDEFIACLCYVRSEKKVFKRIADLCVQAFDDFDRTQIGGEQVTLSAGVVCTNRSDTNFEELYARADKALYQAKRLGKGRAFFEKW